MIHGDVVYIVYGYNYGTVMSTRWNVAAYLDKEEAQAHASAANTAEIQSYNKWVEDMKAMAGPDPLSDRDISYEEFMRQRSEAYMNEYDPTNTSSPWSVDDINAYSVDDMVPFLNQAADAVVQMSAIFELTSDVADEPVTVSNTTIDNT